LEDIAVLADEVEDESALIVTRDLDLSIPVRPRVVLGDPSRLKVLEGVFDQS
jgi:hypothetical protein